MKRLSKTSLAGGVAAALFAASQSPGINSQLRLALDAFCAMGIAWLGFVAADCPPNCPGTDGTGRTRPTGRRLRIMLTTMLSLAMLVFTLSACVTKNPSAGTANPTAPAYVVNPNLTIASNAVVPIAGEVGTITGTGTLPATVCSLCFALLAGISGLVAQHKSKTTSAMAAGVTAQGPSVTAAVLASAADSPKYSAVANALNNTLPSGAAPGQILPTK